MADAIKIEELSIRAVDGDLDAIQGMLDELQGLRAGELETLGADLAQALRDSLELVCDAVEKTDDLCQALFLQMARVGFDSMLLRDRLADCARKAFSDYLDPAGMLFAVGIHNNGAPAAEIPVKWQVFQALNEGVGCVHPIHGCGTVSEIDGLSNEIHVDCGGSQLFPLSVFLDSFHLILPGTDVAGVLSDKSAWKSMSETGLVGVREAFLSSLMPPTDGLDILKPVLVPAVLSAKEFASFTGAKSKPAKAAPKVSSTGSGDDDEVDQADSRPTSAARSLEELRLIVESAASNEFDEEAISNCRELMVAGAAKKTAVGVNDFGRTVILLWNTVQGAEWLVEVLGACAETAVIWTDADQFGEFTNNLSAVQAEVWLKVTFATLPRDRAVDLVLRLPLKNLNLAQRVMKSLGEDDSALVDGALNQVRIGGATADLVVWLWQREKKKCEAIRDSMLVLRTLGLDVRGPYLKANRDLKKMVIGNETFQKFLMGDGDLAMVKRMVTAVRQYTEVLDSGERQSLLVRLARLYPEVREAIETRTRSQRRSQKRKQSKVTSYRSYVERQKELQEIINVKIPENSRAIAHARSYGDLRENAEYKAAKEEQGHLSTRRNEIEKELNQVQPTDFSDVVSPEVIVPGTTVTLVNGSGSPTVYHVVGLWDGNPEASMLSYGTPLGQELLGKTPGDTVELSDGSIATVQSVSELPEDLLAELGRAEE